MSSYFVRQNTTVGQIESDLVVSILFYVCAMYELVCAYSDAYSMQTSTSSYIVCIVHHVQLYVHVLASTIGTQD